MTGTSSLADQFDHLFTIIRSKSFLRKEALGGEIGFFIHAYEPSQQTDVEQATAHLINRLKQQSVAILEINLYDLCIDLLTKQNRLEQIIEREPTMPKDKLLRAMQSSLSVEGRLVPAIEDRLASTPHDVVFLTGVGQVFPFIRSHTILNNLQRVITTPPLVIFFPGQYNGRSLELFGLLHDDNYYRAFNLANLHP